MSNRLYTRLGKFTQYERTVRAYRAAVHALVESQGTEFKKARVEADRLHQECETARDVLRRLARGQ
jgi:hypothetical protein